MPREEMTENRDKHKMLAGELYRASAAELTVERRRAQVLFARYNAISDGDSDLLLSLLREIMGAVGEGTVVMPRFTCDYGYNICLGRNVFINYHCIFLDCAPIMIGNDVQVGPAVQLYTAQHPLEADVRRSGLESARPIRIGNDVWIGGGAVILPGVTIGDRSVVGAGSVVVHSVPPDCVVAGNPARVVRTLASTTQIEEEFMEGSFMEKPAETQFLLHDLLQRRWSPRAFSERMVEPDRLRSLFEAARWAPSSNNEQPWHFILGTKADPAGYDRLFSCLKEGNKKWAFRAPVLLLSVARMHFEDEGTPNRHAWHDTGMAALSLSLQATALGLIAHQMAGFDVEKARADLGIPAGFEPVAMIALGYPGDPAILDERLRQRELAPRERKSAREFVAIGRWNVPPDWQAD